MHAQRGHVPDGRERLHGHLRPRRRPERGAHHRPGERHRADLPRSGVLDGAERAATRHRDAAVERRAGGGLHDPLGRRRRDRLRARRDAPHAGAVQVPGARVVGLDHRRVVHDVRRPRARRQQRAADLERHLLRRADPADPHPVRRRTQRGDAEHRDADAHRHDAVAVREYERSVGDRERVHLLPERPLLLDADGRAAAGGHGMGRPVLLGRGHLYRRRRLRLRGGHPAARGAGPAYPGHLHGHHRRSDQDDGRGARAGPHGSRSVLRDHGPRGHGEHQDPQVRQPPRALHRADLLGERRPRAGAHAQRRRRRQRPDVEPPQPQQSVRGVRRVLLPRRDPRREIDRQAVHRRELRAVRERTMTNRLTRVLGTLMGLAALSTAPARAQVQNQDNTAYGGTSGEFLLLGAGARGAALGGAYAALATDVTALYYNPAGLAQMTRPSLMVSTYSYVANTRYSWVGLGLPLGGGARAIPQENQPARLRASSWGLPVMFRVGVSFDVMTQGQNRVTLLSEFTQPTNTKPGAGAGLEFATTNVGNSGFSLAARGSYTIQPDNNLAPDATAAGFATTQSTSAFSSDGLA